MISILNNFVCVAWIPEFGTKGTPPTHVSYLAMMERSSVRLPLNGGVNVTPVKSKVRVPPICLTIFAPAAISISKFCCTPAGSFAIILYLFPFFINVFPCSSQSVHSVGCVAPAFKKLFAGFSISIVGVVTAAGNPGYPNGNVIVLLGNFPLTLK